MSTGKERIGLNKKIFSRILAGGATGREVWMKG